MLNLIYADLYKLSKSTGAKICFILSCVSAVAFAYSSHCIATGSMSANISGSASGLSDLMILWLLGSLMAGILVCSDFETKTIHDAVVCGNGRSAVVISKALVYIIVVAFIVLPYAVVTIAGFCSGEKFATPFVPSVFLFILANESGISITAAAICKIIVLSLIEIIIYTAKLSICLPIAFKIRKPVVIAAVGLAAGFFIDLAGRLLNDVPVLGNIIKNTPYSISTNVVTMEAGAGTLLKAIVISIVFFVIMTVLTYVLFKRDEIK